MSIMRRIGDKGMTALYLGGWVRKDDIRVEICGAVDELSSFLGMAKAGCGDKKVKDMIEMVQKDLIVLNSEIATKGEFIDKLKNRIDAGYIKSLEKIIEGLEKNHPPREGCFRLAGRSLISGFFDAARTIARRAERRVVTLKNKNMLKNPDILVYLNRLSDLLYLLASH